jgi:hypothetical protein
VRQFYPGASPHGVLRIHRKHGAKLEIDLGLGGGENGSISVNGRRIGTVLELIEGVPSRELVDRIAVAAGWRPETKAPTSRPVLVARATSRFLERYMLAPRGFRTTSGWLDNAAVECEVADWLEVLPDVWATVKDDPFGNRAQTREVALGYWLLHRSADGAPPCLSMQAARAAPSIVFDFETARAIPTADPARARDLYADYLASGHRLAAIVAWIEETLEVG